MSVIEAKQDTLKDTVGLSPEDNEKAIQLRTQLKAAVGRERALRIRRFSSYHRSVGRELREMGEEISTHRNVRNINKASTKHYRQNEGAYQEQAVKDAAAEGVETTFGINSKE